MTSHELHLPPECRDPVNSRGRVTRYERDIRSRTPIQPAHSIVSRLGHHVATVPSPAERHRRRRQARPILRSVIQSYSAQRVRKLCPPRCTRMTGQEGLASLRTIDFAKSRTGLRSLKVQFCQLPHKHPSQMCNPLAPQQVEERGLGRILGAIAPHEIHQSRWASPRIEAGSRAAPCS